MPYTITVFLSVSFIFILIGSYVLGYLLMGVMFFVYHIKRRRDVLIRAGLMHGTFIFLSHIMGAIVSGILVILMYQFEISTRVERYLVTGSALMIAGIVYYILSAYLWGHLAIERHLAKKIALCMCFFAIPWYFLLNLTI